MDLSNSQSSIEDALKIRTEPTQTEEVALLIFRLGASLFGVPALAVREILALPALSPLAETAPFVLGVLNLRGAIVPVMDLSARFEREAPPPCLEDSLVVLDFEGALVALLVSEVRAVSRIVASQIEATPAHGRCGDWPAPLIAGVIRSGEDIVMLLHLPHLLRRADADSSSATRQNLAARFEAQWTAPQRAVLQERAARLIPHDDEISGREEALDQDAARTQGRAPIAVVALGGEEFGVELGMVREFASVGAVTRVPCCPPHILGQINLRGDIVTLLDARTALRTAQTAPPFFTLAKSHPVVVVSHPDGAVGLVVDDVRDVLYPRGDDLLRDAANGTATGYFAASTLYQGRLLPLLDVARFLGEAGLEVEENA